MRRSGLSMGRRMVRFESTNSPAKAAEKAKETASKAASSASEYAAKASQGLSRVTSAAGPAFANAAKGVSGALSRVGGRTGRLVAFIERKEHCALPPCLLFPLPLPSPVTLLRVGRAVGLGKGGTEGRGEREDLFRGPNR